MPNYVILGEFYESCCPYNERRNWRDSFQVIRAKDYDAALKRANKLDVRNPRIFQEIKGQKQN